MPIEQIEELIIHKRYDINVYMKLEKNTINKQVNLPLFRSYNICYNIAVLKIKNNLDKKFK